MSALPVPPILDSLPGRDAVGRVYALYDYDAGREVLGTVIACWPDGGPTWAVRLHEPGEGGRPVVVYLYEQPSSKLGRWHVTQEVPMSKAERYTALVRARKAFDAGAAHGLVNPATVEGGQYDSDEVGPWTRWAGDLDADVMVVGQDWGDVRYFVKQRGFDLPRNPTNLALADLLAGVGRPLPPVPTAPDPGAPDANRTAGVFLTNASLWLKTGGLSAPVDASWFAESAAPFLLEQIAVVQPRVVVALGARAYHAILAAYDLPVAPGLFRVVVETPVGLALSGVPGAPLLFGVYHCGARIRNTTRPLDQQRQDWARIRDALDGRSA